jgi:hypothetical protein
MSAAVAQSARVKRADMIPPPFIATDSRPSVSTLLAALLSAAFYRSAPSAGVSIRAKSLCRQALSFKELHLTQKGRHPLHADAARY